MALADNRAKIQALIAGINALPNAGSGEAPEPVLQEKSVTPTKEAQSVTPDMGYDGLSKVDVGAIPDQYIIPSGTVNITENGTHDVTGYASASVNVPATEFKTQAKTVTPATSAQTVKPDNGYDGLSQVTVSAMPTATQATPSISVSSGGLITASATQSAGYVAAGTKKATKQLTVQAAQTITPGTADKTIPSGRYLTGTQTIKGDGNLTASNIKSGVSIFGVAGTFEGSGGSGESIEMCTVTCNNNYDTDIDFIHTTATGYDKPYMSGNDTFTFTTKKGSLLALYGENIPTHSSIFIEGDAKLIAAQIDTSGMTLAVFFVNGDCSITFGKGVDI